MLNLEGVLGPVTTPFSTSGDVDYVAFAENVRVHLHAGLDGIVVGGSTGEGALLDEQEREGLLEAARGVVPPGRSLLAGAGAESTRSAMRLARSAARCGADAVLVVAPHYYGNAMTPAALSAHYTRIADDSPVPVVLYNIPKYMHFSLSPALVHGLANHPNVAGIKDSSGDLDLLSAYLAAQSEGFTVLTGNGGTFHRALEMGVRGGILAVSLLAPATSLAVYDGMRMRDAQRTVIAQARLTPLSNQIVGTLGVAGIKAALDRIGLVGGPVRSPLPPLSPAEVARVRQLLADAELAAAA